MQISFDLALSPDDEAKLAQVLMCDQNDLAQVFSAYSLAAADEYAQMFLGKTAFRRTQDFYDFRIYLLVIHVLGGRLPDEALVSRLFQTSGTESRARLKSVTSKYQRGLEAQIRGSIQAILEDADHDDQTDTFRITVNNQTIVDLLNSALAILDGNHTQVSKIRGTVASYFMPRASFEALSEHFA